MRSFCLDGFLRSCFWGVLVLVVWEIRQNGGRNLISSFQLFALNKYFRLNSFQLVSVSNYVRQIFFLLSAVMEIKVLLF